MEKEWVYGMKLRREEIFNSNFNKRLFLNNQVLPIVVRLKSE
tara:strand:- start:418 stop:543 length:126 start_codon:yes stop_codon:yes gene_type:complete